MSSFTAGEADAAGAAAPPQETMGAAYRVKAMMPQRGAPEPPNAEPYLMPSVMGRNGSMERSAPGIALTPLGAMMPGQDMPPPQVVAYPGWTQGVPDEAGPFAQGIADGYFDGCPVPFR